ncbi:hypothetical protein [Spirochaeta isovalerica]|uniref:Uncharacterized protein n=1 Tax=Spirochaeta isovalerica TaxID=150 RepID=A0A841RD84_9SPIO|nr:hypothetical protein [Spirochaeta isovalerica]MBB6481197.1 hypothetical protein [Spirochaeta isovalerica]
MMDEIKDEIKGEIRKGIREELQKDWEKEKKRNPHCDADSWWEERRMGMKVFLGVLMGIGFLILGFLFGWVVMLLWNWLMPDIFGLGEVTYWQAWGLLILSSILFKGFPSGNGGDGGKRGDRRRKKELRKMMDSESVFPDRPDITKESPEPGKN